MAIFGQLRPFCCGIVRSDRPWTGFGRWETDLNAAIPTRAEFLMGVDSDEDPATTSTGRWRFNPAPGWPEPPDGWVPPAEFRPDPAWPPAPAGWEFWAWEPDPQATPPDRPVASGPAHRAGQTSSVPLPAAQPPAVGGQKSRRVTVFGLGRVRELSDEVELLRAENQRWRELPAVQKQVDLDALDEQIANRQSKLQRESERHRVEIADLEAKIAALKQDVVTTEEAGILQEVGVYEYRHPLDDSVAYKSELANLKDQIKTIARSSDAVTSSTTWQVNNSAAQGRKMVRDISKLMLRAYNAEADNLVRGMKPYKLDSAIDRLDKVRATIGRLGAAMDIEISFDYHRLRIRELELTADYLQILAEEKERAKEERARLREERKAQEELERERKRLIKERDHHQNAIASARESGNLDGVARLEAELADLERAISDVDYRAANVRAGYVYVISNVGSFGPGMVKIGMTRRLEPMDRVRELGDASVPFRFDIHALFFSKDAYGVEAEMHRRLSGRRVNRVNLRREFFYATPDEVRDVLLDLEGDVVAYESTPEAAEYHQSHNEAKRETQDVSPQA